MNGCDPHGLNSAGKEHMDTDLEGQEQPICSDSSHLWSQNYRSLLPPGSPELEYSWVEGCFKNIFKMLKSDSEAQPKMGIAALVLFLQN